METVFPTDVGLASFFLTSHRMVGGAVEQTGTVIVKRTYDIDSSTGTLTPAESAQPIFDSDQMIPPPEDGVIQYEHDLAAYKPEGDLVVWGFLGPAGLQQARVNGALWLSRNIPGPISSDEVALFGWEPRMDSDRAVDGNFPTDETAYPLPNPLPAGFDNRFYNGYLRAAAQLTTLPYFPIGASITLERAGSIDYEVVLGQENLTATVFVYSGSGPDVEERWQPQTVTLQPDTLVISPADDQCYLVWRGVWPYADYSQTAYRRLVVEMS